MVGKVMQFHQRVGYVYRLIGSGSQQTMHADNSLAPHVHPAQDGGMLLQMGGRSHARSQLRQPERPAHGFQFATGGKFVLHGDDVNGPARMVHSQQGGEYLAIALFVEHLGAELVAHERHGCRFQQAGAEDDFFQVGIVGVQNFSHTFFFIFSS